MRLQILLTSILALVTASLSGCIDADAWESEMDSWERSEETSWEEECEENETDDATHANETGSGSDTAHDHPDPETAYDDATPRYHNVVNGNENSVRTIHIPLGTDSLRVALIHDSDGNVDFTLHDPFYRTMAEEDTNGLKFMDEEEWALIEDPLPGNWHLDIGISGLSAYTVGFYIED